MNARGARKRRGVLGWAWRLLLLLALWLLGVAAYIVLVGERDQAAPADAIIVLGAAAYDARPSPVFEERIRHGIDLYQRGLAKKLIFTGGYGGGGARFSESQVARRYALRQGVPAKAILIESASRNTQENLRQAVLLMQANDLHRAIIVSDPLHMSRALRISRELGIDALGSPTPTTRFRSFTTRWRFLVSEVYFFHRDLLAKLQRVSRTTRHVGMMQTMRSQAGWGGHMKIDGNRKQDRATELVLTYYAAFNRGDWDGMLALLADDVVHDLNQGAREAGREAFATFLARMQASYREQLRDIVVLASLDGDRAAAEYVVHGEYHGSDEGLPPATGQKYVLPGGAFFEIHDDRIARVTNYYNLQDWIAQVGG